MTSSLTYTHGLMGFFTPKGVRNLSAKKDLEIAWRWLYLCPVGSMVESAVKLQTSSPMNNQISRIQLLKGVKSAVNTASFAPTEGRIKEAKEAVAALMSYVESLEAPSKRKASKKRKQKSGKATAATRVADHMDRADHGRPDTPVTPSKRKPKADVEAARKSAEAVSRHTGAAERAERKQRMTDEAFFAEIAELSARIDANTERFNKACDMLLEALPDTSCDTANEVSFSDLPFDPTTTL